MSHYDRARSEGIAAFAAWEDDDYPKLCPRCGAWKRRDGPGGPLLPTCADWRGDPQFNPWPHMQACARVRESDYSIDVCDPCKAVIDSGE